MNTKNKDLTREAKVTKLEPRLAEIEGSVKVILQDEAGAEEEKEVSFAPGFPMCRPISGKDVIAQTQDIMNLARGKVEAIKDFRYKKFAAKPELAAAYEQDLPISQEEALAYIAKLAAIGSALVKIR